MDRRSKLQTLLESTINSSYVYFQPPASVKLDYPCVVFTLSSDRTSYANNKLYIDKLRFTITIIDRNPESELFDKIKLLPLCSFDRTYMSNNLNHYVFTIFF